MLKLSIVNLRTMFLICSILVAACAKKHKSGIHPAQSLSDRTVGGSRSRKRAPELSNPSESDPITNTITNVKMLDDNKKRELKAIAIVFPQYHAIPENDKFWGKNFTEWTMLRPVPRRVNGITTRLPHDDIGFYNILDFEHRKYMREMADHFGIYGFSFYHYWFKDHPVMYKPLQRMLADGEPNKPFFLTWANEPWTKRWDGQNHDILLKQDYSSYKGNIKHFHYLLKYFRHENYIKISGCPVMGIYRIDEKDKNVILALMKIWQLEAVKVGLKCINFYLVKGAFRLSKNVDGVSGFIEFEPLLSWVKTGGGPSIFPNGIFNERIFLENNPDIAKQVTKKYTAYDYYLQEGVTKRRYRTSQFKLHDKNKTWREIEGKNFGDGLPTFRGTFCHWSNAPRRNFTNRDYKNYPHMMVPDSLSGCKEHLATMAAIVSSEATETSPAFLFLTAWNEWNEQSVFEPTDVDGYTALMAVQNSFKASTGLNIQHIGWKKGIIARYIRDLSSLFGHFSHGIENQDSPDERTVLLHVHSATISNGSSAIHLMRKYKDLHIPVYITVHDYDWLYSKSEMFAALEALNTIGIPVRQKERVKAAFAMADRVIFPSASIKDFYLSVLYETIQSSEQLKFELVPNCDVLVKHERYNIPKVSGNVIGVAYVDELPSNREGLLDFLMLVAKLKNSMTVKDAATGKSAAFNVRFHYFGSHTVEVLCKLVQCDPISLKYIVFHDQYSDEILEQLSLTHHVHVLLYLSHFPEAYSYSLTRGINTGLPIVYLNRGARKSNLDPSVSDRYFPVDTASVCESRLSDAIQFASSNSGRLSNYFPISDSVQPSKWFIKNYPPPRTMKS